MDITKFFGLPAHPLLVHIPIVLIPLVGLGAVAIAVSRSMRDRLGWIVVALAGVALVGVQLAIGSGEALEHSVPRSAALTRHTDLAGTMRPLALLLFVAVGALMLADRHLTSARRRHWLAAVAVLTVISAGAANVWIVRLGHNGARATWQRVHVQ
ncbi:MAG: hypothetical protein JWP02_1259 [Acidimicrobiales bacterium]|nr:hypothetical protein [Acidimicrobiales bacterium]